jgi:hypothetical protein
LLTINVGDAPDSFFGQAAAAKLNLPIDLRSRSCSVSSTSASAAGAQQHARRSQLVRGLNTPAAEISEALA